MPLFKKHPKALPFLFLTEMWERFGFYIVQGLLVLYMTQYFGLSDNDSYTILGAFTALAYISPIVGGYVADNLLGFHRCVIWGGLFLILGYALLALPFNGLLYPGLATVIIGTGLFKPNISSILGAQYEAHDPRLDAGFTIFYVGINSGAFLAGLSSGYIREYFGWHMSYGVASVGLFIGLLTFLFGLRHIKNTQSHLVVTKTFMARLFAYCVLSIMGISFLLRVHSLTDWLLPGFGMVLLVFLSFLAAQEKGEARNKMLLLCALIISSVLYWTLYLQMFFAANLFIDRLVLKDVLGVHLTTTMFYASESVFIILLGPIFAWIWHQLSDRNMNPSFVAKFILGIFFAGIGMLFLSIGAAFPNAQDLAMPYWVFIAYFFITVGELFLSPIGLSAVTVLAPPKLTGMMMGVWFVAIGFGGVFAGVVAKLASIPDNMHSNLDKLHIYQHAFSQFAYLAFAVSILLFFLQLGAKRLLRDQHPHY